MRLEDLIEGLYLFILGLLEEQARKVNLDFDELLKYRHISYEKGDRRLRGVIYGYGVRTGDHSEYERTHKSIQKVAENEESEALHLVALFRVMRRLEDIRGDLNLSDKLGKVIIDFRKLKSQKEV